MRSAATRRSQSVSVGSKRGEFDKARRSKRADLHEQQLPVRGAAPASLRPEDTADSNCLVAHGVPLAN